MNALEPVHIQTQLETPLAPKRPYEAPRLIVHGSLTELTAALGQPDTMVASA